MTDRLETLQNYGAIRTEIVALLNAARTASVRSVNALMTATYWEIGRRIIEFEQQGQERAEYGEALIKQLADDLTRQFGRGVTRRLKRLLRTVIGLSSVSTCCQRVGVPTCQTWT